MWCRMTLMNAGRIPLTEGARGQGRDSRRDGTKRIQDVPVWLDRTGLKR